MGKRRRRLLFALPLGMLLVAASTVRAFPFCFSSERGSNRNDAGYYSFFEPSDGPYAYSYRDYPYNPVPDSSWHQPYYPPPAANITGDRGVPVNPWEVPMQPVTESR